MNFSEYAIKPSYLLVHSPGKFDDLARVNHQTLSEYHFTHVPNKRLLYEQHSGLIEALKLNHVSPLEFSDLLSDSQRDHLRTIKDPNNMFTRDPAVTLPWAPKVFISCRFALRSRQPGGVLFHKALTNFGLKNITKFDGSEFLEGGDVIPIWHKNKRVLLVGYGGRTTKSGVIALAKQLSGSYVDLVVGIRHREGVLHLDTGLSILNARRMMLAEGMFLGGFTFEKGSITKLDPYAFLKSIGIKPILVPRQSAIDRQSCNILPIGSNRYVSFKMPEVTRQKLKNLDLSIDQIEGSELQKATGGTHCLTRPIY